MGLDNPLHILIVLVVVLMLFGAKRLPEMGRGIGEGMRSFKNGISGEAPDPPASDPMAQPHQQISLSSAPEPVPAPVSTPAAPVSTPAAAQRESAPIA